MHQRRTSRIVAGKKRIVAATLLAVIMATGLIVVASLDPTEAICSIYTDSNPEWYLFSCWRFPHVSP